MVHNYIFAIFHFPIHPRPRVTARARLTGVKATLRDRPLMDSAERSIRSSPLWLALPRLGFANFREIKLLCGAPVIAFFFPENVTHEISSRFTGKTYRFATSVLCWLFVDDQVLQRLGCSYQLLLGVVLVSERFSTIHLARHTFSLARPEDD